MATSVRLTQVTLIVLRAFLDAPEDSLSGAQIRRKTGIVPGSLYPTLKRLEKAGWLKAEWEDVDPRAKGQPRCRLYALSETGIALACAALKERVPQV
jgi:DNA-binding PadR family transcriptional regulator